MQVRLDDVGDPHAGGTRGGEVDVDVAARIDDRGDPGRLVDDERRQVAEPLDPVLRDAHPASLYGGPMLDSARPERPRPMSQRR